MKIFSRIIVLSILMLFSKAMNSQVLISLLFGNALNTPKIEFGLVGGDNISYFTNVPDSKAMGNFNIGFYFHILLKESSYLSTGVLVKSNVGATGMPTYSVGDAAFDSIYASGTLTTEINYFYVPILFQQRFNNNRWYLEGGFQVGLRNKAYDIFDQNAFDGDLTYTTNVGDDYRRLDAGLMGGAGYKFKKEIKSIAVGVNYYYGLVNVSLNNDKSVKNASAYFYIKIPIGANPEKQKEKSEQKAKKKAAKEAEKAKKEKK
jgi:hypothetical protein